MTSWLGKMLWFGALLSAACTSANEPRAERPSLLTGTMAAPPYASPARWEFHPRGVGGAISDVVSRGESTLLVTTEGERWSVQGEGGLARVAPMLAPEALLDALDLGADGWVFVGASGATYESRSALAGFARSTAPPMPLARVAATSKGLVGVTRAGTVVRSTDLGFNWEAVDVEGRATDVAMLESGHGLLLLAPEGLKKTADGGASWQDVGQERFGAVSLRAEGDDGIRVEGVLGARRWSPESASGWQAVQPVAGKERPKFTVGTRASATALAAGRAAFTRGRYYELASPSGDWILRRGPELAPTTQRAVPALRSCTRVRLAARAASLYAICGEEKGQGAVPVRLYVSLDSGASWKALPQRLRADFDRLQATLLHDGTFVLAGMCPPDASDAGCAPDGVYARRPDGAQLERLGISLLSGVPLALGASADGQRLFVVGKRSKGPELVVFSAQVGDFDFVVEEVRDVSVDADQRFSNRASANVEAISAGADGNVAIVLMDRNRGERAVLVLDSRGRALSLGNPPLADALVGASGGFAVAYAPRSGEVWESLDGGVSWDSQGFAPKALCSSDRQKACNAAVFCWARGCVFDDQFSRVGWRGQESTERRPLSPSWGEVVRSDSLRAPIACKLDEEVGFRSVGAVRPPDASQSQLGDVAWFAFNADWQTASVTMYEAPRGSGAIVEQAELFSKATSAKDYALFASLQIEGVAALRQSRHGVEVAWRNLFEGRRTRRAKLPTAARVAQRPTRLAADLARPALLSITRDGLFLRPSEPTVMASTYLVEGANVRTLPPMAWPSDGAKGRPEMIRAPDGPLAVSLIDAGAAIVRQRHVDGRWQRDAFTLGLLHPELFDIRQAFDLAYLAGRPGLHLMFLDAAPSAAWWFPFEAGQAPLGEPIRVATQRDLSSRPAACTEALRTQSPRAVTPPELGTRHPVLVTHTTEPFPPLVTGDAVLFGAPGDACVASFHATSAARKDADDYTALIVADGSSASWLFRGGEGSEEFDARPMRCEYAPGLELPSEFDSFSSIIP